ncbi:MAG: hypothetical protein OEY28_12750 [Nitrospira sp.]|nr:hypothetical protein [Nitrospira sp.]
MRIVHMRAAHPRVWRRIGTGMTGVCLLVAAGLCLTSSAWAQSVSGVRAFGGGVAPLTRFPGGSLYTDNQGTQGFLYTPGQNFETFSFRNPTTGQAWSGAVGTLGPQLSIGLIQGANQTGNPLVLPGPPRQTAPLTPIQSSIPNFDDIP